MRRFAPLALLSLLACASAATTSAPDAPPADHPAIDTPAAPDVAPDTPAPDAAPDADAATDATPDIAPDVAPDVSPDVAPDTPADLDPCGGLTRCDGVCRDTAFDARHCGRCGNACAPTEECVRGACVMAPCVAPLIACGGACVDAQASRLHCGACGCACPAGSFCSAGNCVVGCAAGLTVCGRVTCGGEDAGVNIRCVDLSNDRANCGRCGAECPTDQFCQAGACRSP